MYNLSLVVKVNVFGNWIKYVEIQSSIIAVEVFDTEPPSVIITSHENGEEITNDVIISGNASDNVMIERVEYRLSDSDTWQIVIGNSSWSLEMNTALMSNGDYTLEFRSYDGTQYSEIVTLTLNVQNEEDDSDGGGFLPGFEAVAIVGTIGVTAISYRKKRKREITR